MWTIGYQRAVSQGKTILLAAREGGGEREWMEAGPSSDENMGLSNHEQLSNA